MHRLSRRVEQFVAAATLVGTVATTIQGAKGNLSDPLERFRNWREGNEIHWINIDTRDDAFRIIMNELGDNFPDTFARSTLLFTQEFNGEDLAVPSDYRARNHRKLSVGRYFDGDVAVKLMVDGHQVEVEYKKPEIDASTGRVQGRPTLVFRMKSRAARDAVDAYLTNIIESYERYVPMLKTLGAWGEWTSRSEVPLRKMEHVALAGGLKQKVIDDIERFLRTEHLYAKISRPYHRGYLFYGPPGTGKTSFAKALADYFTLDMYYINLADLKGDTDLQDSIGGITPRSILVLEDIDSIHAATDREQSDKKITTGALLNALDGMVTPHGLITIMTTNNYEILDEALIRPGRADLQVEFEVATIEQLEEMWASTIGGEITVDLNEYVGKPTASFMDAIANALEAQFVASEK